MPVTDLDLTAALKLFGDPTRLRILALLQAEELSVGELARGLDLSQSRVSNHLRLLREAGLLAERHKGTSCFLRLAVPHTNGSNGTQASGGSNGSNGHAAPGLLTRLWQGLGEELEALPEHDADRARLARVLSQRQRGERAFFDQLAGEWDTRAGDFTSGLGRTRALLQLFPRGGVFADIGCGTGYMARPLLGQAERLILVDASEGMLSEAQRRLTPESRGTLLELRQGSCEQLPILDGELDGLVAGLLLHHLEDLDAALAELLRVLKPGGSAMVLELAPHSETWMHAELGDRHLGLERRDVLAAFERAGFEDIGLDDVDDHYRPERSAPRGAASVDLSLFLIRGRRPAN